MKPRIYTRYYFLLAKPGLVWRVCTWFRLYRYSALNNRTRWDSHCTYWPRSRGASMRSARDNHSSESIVFRTKPGLTRPKIIPGIVLPWQKPGAALLLATGRLTDFCQWNCCTWTLQTQNNTRYSFAMAKSRCSTAIGWLTAATFNQWHCCTWTWYTQNNTGYSFAIPKARCSSAIGSRSARRLWPMTLLHLGFADPK